MPVLVVKVPLSEAAPSKRSVLGWPTWEAETLTGVVSTLAFSSPLAEKAVTT
ncbi:hypothetical protein D3C87_1988800 [compost metagenome]